MKRFIYGITVAICSAALVAGCCKSGSEESKPEPASGESTPSTSSGSTLTGAEAIKKLKDKGFTPLTDPVVADTGGLKSTTIVTKPDMITVNIIEYSDASMAKMAHTASPSSDTMLAELFDRTVVRVVCAGKPKEKCEKVMAAIKE